MVPQVEKAVDQLRPTGEVLCHVVQPVTVDFRNQARFPLHLQRHPERVEPGGVVRLVRVVIQGEQLHPCG